MSSINIAQRLHWIITAVLVVIIAISLIALPSRAANSPFIVHTYTHPGLGSVNTYWIETDESVIVIDGQRSRSEAEKALAQIQATHKPIIGIFLTHAHPDHFGGLRVFADAAPNAPIYGSPLTQEQMMNDTRGYIAASRQQLKEDFPKDIAVPTQLIREDDVVNLGGIEFQVKQLAPNEADAMTLLYVPQAQILFSGDLIQIGMTPFLLEKHIDGWIQQLQGLERMFPEVTMVYPGHGEAGDKHRLIQSQLAYLTQFRELISSHLGDDQQLSSTEKEEILQQINTQYPGYQPVAAIPDLLSQNIDAIAKKQ